jgi:hypothetical protein
LNKHGAEFLVVGAHALAFHGAPRFTGDLDLWIRASPENARRVLAALHAFGFGGLGVSEPDLAQPGRVIHLGFPPNRIDLLTSLTGLSWEEAWHSRISGQLGGQPVHWIGREALKKNKLALGRAKDLADVEALKESPPERGTD